MGVGFCGMGLGVVWASEGCWVVVWFLGFIIKAGFGISFHKDHFCNL